MHSERGNHKLSASDAELESLCQFFVETGTLRNITSSEAFISSKSPYDQDHSQFASTLADEEEDMTELIRKYHENNQRFLKQVERGYAGGFGVKYLQHPLFRRRRLESIYDDDWSEHETAEARLDEHIETAEIQRLELTSSESSQIQSPPQHMQGKDQDDIQNAQDGSGSDEYYRPRRKKYTPAYSSRHHGKLAIDSPFDQDSLTTESSKTGTTSEDDKKKKLTKKRRRKEKEKEFLKRFIAELESERTALCSEWRKEFELPNQKSVDAIVAMNNDRKKKVKMKEIHREKETKFMKKFMRELEAERGRLVLVWKEEFTRDSSSVTSEQEYPTSWYTCSISTFFSLAEVFVANIPLTIGAVGLSWVLQGIIWFKLIEQNLDECKPVDTDLPLCSFPEFTGCFECDSLNVMYRTAVSFNSFCRIMGGIFCTLILLKFIFGWKIVIDELSNPVTCSPCGFACITATYVAVGHGITGEAFVLGTSIIHALLSFWFLYIAVFKYRLLPDPSWLPNTVGIGYGAVKASLYFPLLGEFLVVLCIIFFFGIFFISLIRIAMKNKLSAPVCFLQLSASSILLFVVTAMDRLILHHELEDVDTSLQLTFHSNKMIEKLYLPIQHLVMILSLIGMVSALHSLYLRWDKFCHKEFSPAHFAFAFSIVCHTHAVQAYLFKMNLSASSQPRIPFKVALFGYWFSCLIVGTIVNLFFTAKYIKRIFFWTKIHVSEEEEEETRSLPHSVLQEDNAYYGGNHQHAVAIQQSPINVAVFHANDVGALVRVRRGSVVWNQYGNYVRTRKIQSLGFDPIMTASELEEERSELEKEAPQSWNFALYGTFPFAGNEVEATNHQQKDFRQLDWTKTSNIVSPLEV